MQVRAVLGDRDWPCVSDWPNDVVVEQRQFLRRRSVRRCRLQAVTQYKRLERRLPARLLYDRDAGARLPRRRTHGDDALRHDQA